MNHASFSAVWPAWNVPSLPVKRWTITFNYGLTGMLKLWSSLPASYLKSRYFLILLLISLHIPADMNFIRTNIIYRNNAIVFAGLLLATFEWFTTSRIITAWVFLFCIEMIFALVKPLYGPGYVFIPFPGLYLRTSALAVHPAWQGPDLKFSPWGLHFIPFIVFFAVSVIFREEPILDDLVADSWWETDSSRWELFTASVSSSLWQSTACSRSWRYEITRSDSAIWSHIHRPNCHWTGWKSSL